MRFNLPFNDDIDIIWNENGRSGLAYDSGREDTFEHTRINNSVAGVSLGAVTQLLLFPFK